MFLFHIGVVNSIVLPDTKDWLMFRLTVHVVLAATVLLSVDKEADGIFFGSISIPEQLNDCSSSLPE
jgi:predicted Abi (CAAX) family protease